MGACNSCTLRGIRARAEKEGKTVLLAPGSDGGVAVFVLGGQEKPITWAEKDANQLPASNQVAWFMALTNGCAC